MAGLSLREDFLSWYVGHGPVLDTLPAEVRMALRTLGKPFNEPNTAAQGSKRLVPGLWPFAVAWRAGELHDLSGLAWFVTQEEAWRAFPAGQCPAVAIDPDGVPWLNDAGKPVPVNKWDAQHFIVTQLACIAAIAHEAGDEALSTRAFQQAAWLMDDYFKSPWADPAHSEDNPRARGWPLRELAIWYRATGDARAVQAATVIVADIEKQRGSIDMGGGVVVPWLLRNAEGSHQADHGLCMCCTWMESTIPQGLGWWTSALSATAATGPASQSLLLHAAWCLDYAMTKGEHPVAPGFPAQLGRHVDDYYKLADPTATHEKQPGYGPMDRWTWAAWRFICELLPGKAAKQHWPLRIAAAYAAANVMKPSDVNFKDQHQLSIALFAAPWLGWRK